jgi:hypothetical protein
MTQTPLFKWLLLLTGGGVLFSGYLSGVKFFAETCAFGEACPYFLGYPACYYGFAMFSVLFITTVIALMQKLTEHQAKRVLMIVSSLGILFAGYFTFGELPKLFSEGLKAYMLGLPTCALGLIFYIAVFGISYRISKKV